MTGIDYRESPYNIDTNKKIEAAGMRAALDTKQEILPIGTILMYDGTNWQDNITLAGWYRCDAVNKAVGRTPNLTDRFIMGGVSAGTENGTNALLLETKHLPAHSHSITDKSHTHDTHNGKFTVSDGDGKLDINNTEGCEFVQVSVPRDGGVFSVENRMKNEIGNWAEFSNLGGSYTPEKYGNGTSSGLCETVVLSAAHSQASTGITSTNNSANGGQTFDNRPAYYTVIYIKRCA